MISLLKPALMGDFPVAMFDETRGYIQISIINAIKPPFSYGFPMEYHVFQTPTNW